MTQELWTAVDNYFAEKLLPPDPALDHALEASAAAGLPEIAVTPHQGKFLNLLAKLAGARSILEIGTLGGYSTIWLARALAPGGNLVTLEAVPKHAEVARANIAKAGLGGVVDIRVGPALDTLPTLTGPFDLVFIDADKQNNPHYFQWAVRLAKPGTVIVVDNVVRQGAVANATSEDEAVRGVRALHDLIEAEPRAEATALQTVGAKGYDGCTVAIIRE
ncbi:O-methyltransferase [Amycolatopsis minnesotensis]|uniref:O-methyltransferase n=1 Tax=Amycolatopsis minnesotensis TaxID=337894 RepID=A0ABN2S8R3_9PSEU